MDKFSKLEKLIQYRFRDSNLLTEALTHRSYLNENPQWHLNHNERLEFLGDAVLELAVSEILYKKYPDHNEGQLTVFRAALVNYQALAEVAKKLSLDEFLLLSKGEAKDNGRAREVILANAIEALIGAIYLDSGYTESKEFIEKFVTVPMEEIVTKESYRDAKSLLQEKTQADLKLTPVYKVISERGPDHNKTFIVGVYFKDKLIAEGKGFSKQEAEVEAARQALEQLKA